MAQALSEALADFTGMMKVILLEASTNLYGCTRDADKQQGYAKTFCSGCHADACSHARPLIIHLKCK
jgi:hypothetical protein